MSESEYEIKNCICGWYDLLGYGAPFINAKWNLNDDRCKMNYERIKNVSLPFTTSWSALPLGTRLSFNDGFASTIDYDDFSNGYENIIFFLEGIVKDFDSINSLDKRRGFPGARGIITCGQRFSHVCTNSTYNVHTKQITSYHPIEFQMNTAFSKAFIMEESGVRANLTGSNLYIDLEIYYILKEYAEKKGHKSPEIIYLGQKILIKIYLKNSWFLDIYFDREKFVYGQSEKYSNRGIEALLYKYIANSLHSTIDEYAAEVAHRRAYIISQMEKMEDYEND